MKAALIFSILTILSGCTDEESSSFSPEGKTSEGCYNIIAYYDSEVREFRTIITPVYKEVCE